MTNTCIPNDYNQKKLSLNLVLTIFCLKLILEGFKFKKTKDYKLPVKENDRIKETDTK